MAVKGKLRLAGRRAVPVSDARSPDRTAECPSQSIRHRSRGKIRASSLEHLGELWQHAPSACDRWSDVAAERVDSRSLRQGRALRHRYAWHKRCLPGPRTAMPSRGSLQPTHRRERLNIFIDAVTALYVGAAVVQSLFPDIPLWITIAVAALVAWWR